MERVFKVSSTGSGALFYKPEGKAGEVWALHADRVGAWLQPPDSGDQLCSNRPDNSLPDETSLAAFGRNGGRRAVDES